jgi:hypothetical protein
MVDYLRFARLDFRLCRGGRRKPRMNVTAALGFASGVVAIL